MRISMLITVDILFCFLLGCSALLLSISLADLKFGDREVTLTKSWYCFFKISPMLLQLCFYTKLLDNISINLSEMKVEYCTGEARCV